MKNHHYYRKLIKIAAPFLFLAIQACYVPGYHVDTMQLGQMPQKQDLNSIKRGIVVFKGTSCTDDNNGNSSNIDFFNRIQKFFAKCNSYVFRSEKNYNYYIKQFTDSAGIKSTYAEASYFYYTVPAGKYYYGFSKSKADEVKDAFYFEVKEGHAIYAGDFFYDKSKKMFKVVNNYENTKVILQDQLPVPLEKSLAKGSKVINN